MHFLISASMAEEASAADGGRKKARAGPRKRRPRKARQASGASEDGAASGGDAAPPDDLQPPESHDEAPRQSLRPAAAPFTPASSATRQPQTLRYASPPTAVASPFEDFRRARSEPFGAKILAVPTDERAFHLPPGLAPPDFRSASYLLRSYQLAASSAAAPEVAPRPATDEDNERREREYWTQWVIEAAEKERARRLNLLRQLQIEEEEEIRRRRQWAIAAIEKEQEAMMREMFLDNMKNTQWFQTTISRFSEDYEVVCPNSWFGCTFSCMLKDLELHLESCVYRQVPDTLDQVGEEYADVDFYSYDVVCPNAVLGCKEICSRENLAQHLATCPVNGISREKEWEERLEWRRNVILASEQERERRMHELSASNNAELSFGHLQRLYEEQTAMLQVVLHDEIVDFYTQAQQEARVQQKWVDCAVKRVKEEMCALWGNTTEVEGYGSFTTELYGAASDVDLVVFGVTDTHHLTCQQCVGMLADHLQTGNLPHEFVEISALTRASIPLLKVVVVVSKASTVVRIPFDITFDEPEGIWHNGVASAALINMLATHFYGVRELAMVLKHFLVKRRLNDPYVGGLSSYGLLLMILHILLEQSALISNCNDPRVQHSANYRVADIGKIGLPADSSRRHIQRFKGEKIAREIVRQSIVKQQQRQQQEGDEKPATRRKRAVLPTLLTGMDGDHESKPCLLGKLLMDFLHFYGNDFRQNVDQVCVLNRDDVSDPEVLEMTTSAPTPTGVRSLHASPSHGSISAIATSPTTEAAHRSPVYLQLSLPAHISDSPPVSEAPLSQDGVLVIHDPLQLNNNVGKSCYRVSQVFREFSDFLSFLTALIVRGNVMTTGKKDNASNAVSMEASSSPSDTSNTKPGLLTTDNLQPTSTANKCRILMSVFEMKAREKRSSLDFSERPKESG